MEKITVKIMEATKKTISFRVKASDKIEHIKARLAKHQEVDTLRPDQLELTFKGGELEDQHTISYYHIKEGSTIYMASKIYKQSIEFIVRLDKMPAYGSPLTFEMKTSETVRDLRAMLQKIAPIPIDDMTLYHYGYLEDHHTIGQTNILNGSTVYLLGKIKDYQQRRLNLELAIKHTQEKMICRKCYARLPPQATHCRKKKCHSNDLRPTKKFTYHYNYW